MQAMAASFFIYFKDFTARRTMSRKPLRGTMPDYFKVLTVSAAKQIISQQQQNENNQYSKHYIGQKNHNCHSHCNPKQNKSYQPFHAITRKTHILLFNICALPKIIHVLFIPLVHSTVLPVPVQPPLSPLFLPSSVLFLNSCW